MLFCWDAAACLSVSNCLYVCMCVPACVCVCMCFKRADYCHVALVVAHALQDVLDDLCLIPCFYVSIASYRTVKNISILTSLFVSFVFPLTRSSVCDAMWIETKQTAERYDVTQLRHDVTGLFVRTSAWRQLIWNDTKKFLNAIWRHLARARTHAHTHARTCIYTQTLPMKTRQTSLFNDAINCIWIQWIRNFTPLSMRIWLSIIFTLDCGFRDQRMYFGILCSAFRRPISKRSVCFDI